MFRTWLFFFFKQKTAYEMRISDWSSDVCSSDLFGRLDTGGSSTVSVLTATQEVIGVAADTGSQAWMRQSVGLVMDGTSNSVASTPDAAALDIVGDIEIRAEIQRDSWSDITTTQDLVEKWGAAGTRSRSEEHTSELQSLMRNSYAV